MPTAEHTIWWGSKSCIPSTTTGHHPRRRRGRGGRGADIVGQRGGRCARRRPRARRGRRRVAIAFPLEPHCVHKCEPDTKWKYLLCSRFTIKRNQSKSHQIEISPKSHFFQNFTKSHFFQNFTQKSLFLIFF